MSLWRFKIHNNQSLFDFQDGYLTLSFWMFFFQIGICLISFGMSALSLVVLMRCCRGTFGQNRDGFNR